jgi:hypothetical protein
MEKVLIESPTQLVKILEDRFDSVEDFENFLGVEFSWVDGTFRSEVDFGKDEYDEGQDVDFSNYKILEENLFPTSYPCVAGFIIEDEMDRFGKVRFQFLDYVYPSDFIKKD